MRKLFGKLALVCAVVAASTGLQSAFADAINVYSTGVDDSHALLGALANDTHYSINAGSGPIVVPATGGGYGDSVQGNAWVGNTTESQWITSGPPNG